MPVRASSVLARFLPTHESDPVLTWTYAQMHERACHIASALQTRCARGERVLIMTTHPEDFLTALFGCWYAGVIAVPVYPPNTARRASSLERLQTIIKDCEARCMIMPAALSTWMPQDDSTQPLQSIVLEDALDAAHSFTPHAAPDEHEIALLQYTSGSTGDPKGVVLTHANVLANLRLFAKVSPLSGDDHVVNWMPLFHDLGLSLFLCAPYAGVGATLLTPEGFLRRPARWLEAISTHRGVFSGAPNFAYELCLARVTKEELKGLDLSCWRAAMNAAEPVRLKTLEHFNATFAPVGFSPEAMMPSYGLAEATAFGSAGRSGELPVIHLDPDALQRHLITPQEDHAQAQAFVGCGKAYLDSQVRIVNPETGAVCGDLELGEIWLTGPQIGRGYWGQPERSLDAFGARIPGEDATYLKTGDLGFLQQRELFVTGRLKDLIILRGRNHYPQDIELTIEQAHKGIRPGCVAAFSMAQDTHEGLVVIAEVRDPAHTPHHEAMAETLRASVLERHGITLEHLVFVAPRTLHKTSSGKIQRRACQQSLRDDSFVALSSHRGSSPTLAAPSTHRMPANDVTRAARQWLAQTIARHVDHAPDAVRFDLSFAELGLDSQRLIELLPALEQHFGCRLEPQVYFAHPTIDALAHHLVQAPHTHEAMTSQVHTPQDHDKIAIVGAACRLPGGIVDLSSMWTFLESGQDAITTTPKGRWIDTPHTTHDDVSSYGAFLDGIDAFDAGFFGVSGQEAAQMDPQQRLLLEIVWEAIEHAGCSTHTLDDSRTGVFVGMSSSDYAAQRTSHDALDTYTGTATALSVAAGRIAYFLNLHGPALVLDTACSSSLVALHTACQSILTGDSDMAIACGVNLVLSPAGHLYLNRIGAMAADGRCKTFDERADGYVRGEGAVALVLKPLAQARQDGDRILGLISGSSVNHDGRTNGLTAPSVHAQSTCYAHALSRAALHPTDIDYIEAHGTGTHLGDPIEVQGLHAVYGEGRAADSPLYLGAVKSQLGHGEAVAGLTGVLKVLCMFAHDHIPAQANFQTPNSLIDWQHTPLEVPREPIAWPCTDAPRHAAVSSFGISGTNAHVLLSHTSDLRPTHTFPPVASDRTLWLPLSARHPEALRELGTRYAHALDSKDVHLDDLIYSASRRTQHNLRVGITAPTRDELAFLLRQIDTSDITEARRPRIVFVFPGHGSQWQNMGRALWDIPECRDTLEACERAFAPFAQWSLRAHLLEPDECEHWGRIDRVQPMIFAVQMALANLWKSWGILPDAVIGHSMGEVAAMCQAGTLTLEDAARIICTRSRLMCRIEGQGEMAVVGISYEEAERWMAPWSSEVAIGVHNSPEAVVFSGSPLAIAAMIDRAERQDVFARRVKIKLASHSPQTEVLRDDLIDALAPISPQTSRLPVFSTVEASYIEDTSTCAPEYWFRNLREPVRFAPSLQALAAEQTSVFIEVSPHPVLCSAMNGMFKRGKFTSSCVPSMRRDQSAESVLTTSLAQLHEKGIDPHWEHVIPQARLVDTPAYPFQRQRYWLSLKEPASAHRVVATSHVRSESGSMLGTRQHSVMNPAHQAWPVYIDLTSMPWLEGHRVKKAVILPATCFVELAMQAATQAFGAPPRELGDLVFSSPLFVQAQQSQAIQIELLKLNEGLMSFQIASRREDHDDWTTHAHGTVRAQSSMRHTAHAARTEKPTLDLDSRALYSYFGTLGLGYEGAFQRLHRAHVAPALAHAQVNHDAHPEQPMHLHPATLDACLQTLGLAQLAELPEQGVCIPIRIGRICLFGELAHDPNAQLDVEARSYGATGDILVRNEAGAPLLWIEHVSGHPLDPHHASKPTPQAPWHVAQGEGYGMLDEVWRPWTPDTQAPLQDFAHWLVIGGGQVTDSIAGVLERASASVARSPIQDLAQITAQLVNQSITQLIVVCDDAQLDGQGATRLMTDVMRCVGALDRALTVWIVTQHATHVTADDSPELRLEQAALWGLSHAFELEYPHLVCKRLDLDVAYDESSLKQVLTCDSPETRHAIRPGGVFVARLTRTPELKRTQKFDINPHGTYVITGGHGAFGARIADALVEQGAQCVALLSRHGAHNEARLDHLNALKVSGAELIDLKVDVSDKEALAQALQHIKSHGPAIRGVFHTAGVLDDHMLSHLTHEAIARTFAAKVLGARHLHDLSTQMSELEHFVLFSSATSTIGSPGQGAYSAANASLDAIARQRVRQGLVATSIRWCPLLEDGMASAEQVQRLAHRGITHIDSEDIAPMLAAMMSRRAAVHMPLDLDLERFQQFYPGMATQPFYEELLAHNRLTLTRDERFITRLQALPASSRIDALERFLQAQIAQLLSMETEHISRTRSVQELGFDSLITLELRNQLETVLGISLSSSFVWRHPSVAQLAVALFDEMNTLDPHTTTPLTSLAFPVPAQATFEPDETPLHSRAEIDQHTDDELLNALLHELHTDL